MTVELYRNKLQDFPPANMEYAGVEYRRFNLTRDPIYLLWKIETLEQGAPPSELRGVYTSKREAQNAIDNFQDKKKKE